MEAELLQIEVLRLAVEHGDTAAVLYRCLLRHDPVPYQLPCVYPIFNLHILKYAKVHVCLQSSQQRRIKSKIMTIADIVRPETDCTYRLLPVPSPPSRITTHTPTHA